MENREQLEEKRERIAKGLEQAYKKLVEFKKQKNSPMVISRNGEVVEVDPHDVPPTTTYRRKL